MLKNGHALGGIYNLIGESLGLAQVIKEVHPSRRPLYITHELDESLNLCFGPESSIF